VKNKIINFSWVSSLICGMFLLLTGNTFAQSLFSVDKEIIGGAKNSTENNAIHFKVMLNKKKIYTIKKTVDYDIPFPDLKVFDTGASVLLNSFEGSLTFFDKNGIESFSKKIVKNIDVKYERSIQAVVDEDKLVIGLSQPGIKNSLVQIYDSRGDDLGEWYIEQEFINGLQFSNKQKRIALSTHQSQESKLIKSLLIFDDQANLLIKEEANFTKGEFIPNEPLFAARTNKTFFLYNFQTEKFISNVNVPSGEIILDFDYDDQNFFLVTSPKPFLEAGEWFYQNPIFAIYNFSGKEQRSWKENISPFSKFRFERIDLKIKFVTNKKTIQIN